MIANAIIALSFVVLAILIGWFGYLTLVQRRELDACARTLRDLIDAFNASPAAGPDVRQVQADPELPWVPPSEAPMGTEPLVKVGGVAWAEWDGEASR